jgi:hypothetical protein
MHSKRMVTIGTVVAALILLLAASSAGAGPPAEGDQGAGKISLAGTVASKISYQGRLTDSDGVPLSGQHNLVFQLWNDPRAGGQVGGDIVRHDVDVSSGLFTVDLDVPQDAFTGQALWLRIQVDGQWLSGRQELLPVPYALSLRPGAAVQASQGMPLLTMANNGAGSAVECVSLGPSAAVDAFSATGDAVVGEAQSADRSGVYGHSVEGFGVTGSSEDGAGVQGLSTDGPGGLFNSSDDDGIEVCASDHGVHVLSAWHGVLIDSARGDGILINYAAEDGIDISGVGWDGITVGNIGRHGLVLWGPPGGDYIQAGRLPTVDFKVTNDGEVWSEGYHTNPDFAELMSFQGVAAACEPGDVLAVSADSDRAVALASEPYSTMVMGVYSEKPGLVGSPHVMEGQGDHEVAVAIVGIVPCKVSAENGPIRRGDLLVTSSTAGHAMRADTPTPGTILGKALGELESGTGVIDVLVTLQ